MQTHAQLELDHKLLIGLAIIATLKFWVALLVQIQTVNGLVKLVVLVLLTQTKLELSVMPLALQEQLLIL